MYFHIFINDRSENIFYCWTLDVNTSSSGDLKCCCSSVLQDKLLH